MSKKPPLTTNDILVSRLSPLEWALILLVTMVSTVTVVLTLDPARRLHEASNARRFSDVSGLSDEIFDFKHAQGALPASLLALEPEFAYEIGHCEANASCRDVEVQDSCVDLSELGEVPSDPKNGYPEHSAYYVIVHKDGEITVGACEPDPEGITGDGPIPAINLRD